MNYELWLDENGQRKPLRRILLNRKSYMENKKIQCIKRYYFQSVGVQQSGIFEKEGLIYSLSSIFTIY